METFIGQVVEHGVRVLEIVKSESLRQTDNDVTWEFECYALGVDVREFPANEYSIMEFKTKADLLAHIARYFRGCSVEWF